MHEVLVNRLGGLSLPRKSVVRLTDRPDMTLDVYRGRKTTMQQQQEATLQATHTTTQTTDDGFFSEVKTSTSSTTQVSYFMSIFLFFIIQETFN